MVASRFIIVSILLGLTSAASVPIDSAPLAERDPGFWGIIASHLSQAVTTTSSTRLTTTTSSIKPVTTTSSIQSAAASASSDITSRKFNLRLVTNDRVQRALNGSYVLYRTVTNMDGKTSIPVALASDTMPTSPLQLDGRYSPQNRLTSVQYNSFGYILQPLLASQVYSLDLGLYGPALQWTYSKSTNLLTPTDSTGKTVYFMTCPTQWASYIMISYFQPGFCDAWSLAVEWA